MSRKYDSYKDSGVEWIGEIPKHWVTKKMKYLVEICNGSDFKEHFVEEGGFPVFGSGGEFSRSSKYLYDDTSVLLGRKGSVDKPKIVYEPFWCSDTTYYTKIFHIINPQFFYYLVQLIDFDKHTYGSTIPSMTKSVYEEMVFPFVHLSEQLKIVDYLDTKTSIIDSLIEKTQRKIELLKEKRTSLINEVVTKGLNPNVEMKDSGVEWIGEIPKHWKTIRVKFLLKPYEGIKIGPFGSSLKLDSLTDSGIKIYGQSNVIKEDFSLGERYLTEERFESEFQQYEILDGDVLVTMMGTTGKCKVFSKDFERGILDSHLLRLRFDEEIFNSILFSIILEKSHYLKNQIRLMSKGSIMEGLNSSIVKDLIVLSPPIGEQLNIISFLNGQTSIIDKTISIEERRIELLKEYRQSLISEVVTGKVKVTTDEHT
jgi:type I restriction enzyme, S subunit